MMMIDVATGLYFNTTYAAGYPQFWNSKFLLKPNLLYEVGLR